MWMNEWRAIGARIAALLDAGTFFLRPPDNDNYGGAGILIENAAATVSSLRQFLGLHGNDIPAGPKACLNRFLKDCHDRFGGSMKTIRSARLQASPARPQRLHPWHLSVRNLNT